MICCHSLCVSTLRILHGDIFFIISGCQYKHVYEYIFICIYICTCLYLLWFFCLYISFIFVFSSNYYQSLLSVPVFSTDTW
ncbi:unnamed protein product, partial [Cylicocyclus nassatus]